MFFLLYLAIIVITYVTSFKESFNTENLDKLKPALAIVLVLTALLAILGSM